MARTTEPAAAFLAVIITTGDPDEQVIALSRIGAIVMLLLFDHPDIVGSPDMLLQRMSAQSTGIAGHDVDTFTWRCDTSPGATAAASARLQTPDIDSFPASSLALGAAHGGIGRAR